MPGSDLVLGTWYTYLVRSFGTVTVKKVCGGCFAQM